MHTQQRRASGRGSRRAVFAALVALLVVGWPAIGPASADPAGTPQQTWVTNGRVKSMLRIGGRIYLAGAFTQVGPSTGHGVAVDNTAGSRNTGFPEVNGTVYAAVPDGSGGWYLGGDFSSVGSSFRKNAAHVTSTGNVTTWNPKVDSIVRALAYSPTLGDVFLGGDFVTVNGGPRA